MNHYNWAPTAICPLDHWIFHDVLIRHGNNLSDHNLIEQPRKLNISNEKPGFWLRLVLNINLRLTIILPKLSHTYDFSFRICLYILYGVAVQSASLFSNSLVHCSRIHPKATHFLKSMHVHYWSTKTCLWNRVGFHKHLLQFACWVITNRRMLNSGSSFIQFPSPLICCVSPTPLQNCHDYPVISDGTGFAWLALIYSAADLNDQVYQV